MAGKPGCGGKKGRSGRRPLSIEMKRLAVIQKSWDVADQFLNDKTIGISDKMEHAIKIVTKDIPDQVKHSGGITLNYGHRSKDKNADTTR